MHEKDYAQWQPMLKVLGVNPDSGGKGHMGWKRSRAARSNCLTFEEKRAKNLIYKV